MSSKITKQMIARVDDMVSMASGATKQEDEATKKGKAARRAIVGALSLSKRGDRRTPAKSEGSSRTKATKRKTSGAQNGPGRRGLLEEARRELQSQSKLERNVSILTFSRQGKRYKKKIGVKAKNAMKQLLQRDEMSNGAKKPARK